MKLSKIQDKMFEARENMPGFDLETIKSLIDNVIEKQCIYCANLGLDFTMFKYKVENALDVQFINYIFDIEKDFYFEGFYISVDYENVDFVEFTGYIKIFISWGDVTD